MSIFETPDETEDFVPPSTFKIPDETGDFVPPSTFETPDETGGLVLATTFQVPDETEGWVTLTASETPSEINGLIAVSASDFMLSGVNVGATFRIQAPGVFGPVLPNPRLEDATHRVVEVEIGGEPARLLLGDGDDDIIVGGDESEILVGGAGDDQMRGDGGDDQVFAGAGADFARGDAGDDVLSGGGGDDVMIGGRGADLLKGGAGNDNLGVDVDGGAFSQGVAENRLAGQDGDDAMRGGDGFDRLNGGDGADVLFGGGGLDLLFGGAGADIFQFEAFFAPPEFTFTIFSTVPLRLGSEIDVILDFNPGEDRIDLQTSRITEFDALKTLMFDTSYGMQIVFDDGVVLKIKGVKVAELDAEHFIFAETPDPLDAFRRNGGSGDDTLEGGVFVDQLQGNNGDDVLSGGASADVLVGGAGDDRLFGGTGDDLLDGGAGLDRATGGAGADTFRFAAGDEFMIVEDFDAAEDRLSLVDSGFDDLDAMLAAAVDIDGFGMQLALESGDTLVLLGVSKADFDADNVAFSEN